MIHYDFLVKNGGHGMLHQYRNDHHASIKSNKTMIEDLVLSF